MISFLISIALLVAGYLVYGKMVERIFGVDARRTTPAFAKQDGVDYMPMSGWRIFLIQFLNIAGLGPIFGAIMGAKFGEASFLWIVFGCIFGGAVHDYLAGMISLRQDGASLPEIHGRYLGGGVKKFMRFFMVGLMILVGVVFVTGPAGLLADLTSVDAMWWIAVIMCYYVFATMVSIDKIIGKIYPVFGFVLIFMAAGVLFALFYNNVKIPEIWDGLGSIHPQKETTPLFPMMFISIACGAISGFHATQSPLMARCMTNERQGRPIFYGCMIAEGVMALIWAAAATYYFRENGMEESNAAVIVKRITSDWLGLFGSTLAILGVVFAPITSGDTAFRSARLIIADAFGIDQHPVAKRLLISIPLFAVGTLILCYALLDKNGFDIIWRYFAWANQTLSVFTLWAVTVYLSLERKPYIITLLPALFMTMICSTFIFIAQKEGLGLPHGVAYALGGLVTLATLAGFLVWRKKAAL